MQKLCIFRINKITNDNLDDAYPIVVGTGTNLKIRSGGSSITIERSSQPRVYRFKRVYMFTSVGQWYFKITNPNTDKFIFYFDSVEYGQNVHKPYNNLLKCTPSITENNTYKYGLTVTSDGITIIKLSTEVSVTGSEIGSSEQTFMGNLIYFR